jgi:NAD(P)-dependent dehydrogenase (short-subunit alcohol dehydrogenase family)
VNAISPGAIPTEAETRAFGDQLKEYEAFILGRQSLKRRGTAEEIAGIILFLASDASAFITGQNLVADGGFLMN